MQVLDFGTDPEGAIMFNGLKAGISVGGEQAATGSAAGPNGNQVVFFGE